MKTIDFTSLTDILVLTSIAVLIASIVYLLILNVRKNKIFKNAIWEKCPKCGIPMRYRSSFSRAWECPDCRIEILLLLDKNKKAVKLECMKMSSRYKDSWIVISILILTVLFAAALFGPHGFGYVVGGFMFIIVGILIALGVVPPAHEYDGRSLDKVKLKYSVEKIRLFNCVFFLTCAIFLICKGMEINPDYLAPLMFLFSICCACMIYISEHNVISEK